MVIHRESFTQPHFGAARVLAVPLKGLVPFGCRPGLLVKLNIKVNIGSDRDWQI